MREDLFVLVIGYGKTGTSLCMGLIGSSPEFNVGYEINNPIINRGSFTKSIPILSKEFNGNKITIVSYSSLPVIKFLVENRIGFLHGKFKFLKVVFTKRDPINALVCRHEYFLNKGRKPTVEGLVEDYLGSMILLEELKEYFTEKLIPWYLFDFDSVLSDPLRLSEELFAFVEEKFKKEYVIEYRGKNNYSHAVGVGVENVLFGKEDKFPKLRRKFVKEFIRVNSLKEN